MTERVIDLDLGVVWEPNAPSAVLLVEDSGRSVLAMLPHAGDADSRIVVLAWQGTIAATMQPPNDESIEGHRLYGKGLRGVQWIGEVLASEWIAELEQRNRVHPRHDPERFNALRHFVLPLKERTVEVIARSVDVRRQDAGSPLLAATKALHA